MKHHKKNKCTWVYLLPLLGFSCPATPSLTHCFAPAIPGPLPVHGFVSGHPPLGVSLLVLADGVVVVVVVVFHTVFVAA